MATWKKATGEPITTERQVRVYNPETGEEGHVGVSWDLLGPRYHVCRFYGPVVKLDRIIDMNTGVETEEPRRTILDADPTFA